MLEHGPTFPEHRPALVQPVPDGRQVEDGVGPRLVEGEHALEARVGLGQAVELVQPLGREQKAGVAGAERGERVVRPLRRRRDGGQREERQRRPEADESRDDHRATVNRAVAVSAPPTNRASTRTT